MRAITAVMLVAAACGGGGDDGGSAVDAPTGGTIDAPPGGNPDAPPTGGSALGTACTGTGQGSCPTGFECLNLQGGSGSWCSKLCVDQNDLSCNQGYTGPGYGFCILDVGPMGGPTRRFCTILCDDAAGAPTLCPTGEDCNGMCPTPLMCTGAIRSGQNVVGHTCE